MRADLTVCRSDDVRPRWQVVVALRLKGEAAVCIVARHALCGNGSSTERGDDGTVVIEVAASVQTVQQAKLM